MSFEAVASSPVQGVRWRLPDSPAPFGYSGVELADFLAVASHRTAELRDKYQHRVSSLDGAELARLLNEVAAERDAIARAEHYVQLRLAEAPSDPESQALRAVVRNGVRPVRANLAFFALEWAELSEEAVKHIFDAPELKPYRGYLEAIRSSRRYTLSAREEDILRRKSLASRQYWQDLFNDRCARIEVTVDGGQTASLNGAIGHLFDPERAVRERWWMAIAAALKLDVDVRAAAIRALVADKAADDAIRKYPSWLTARQLASGLTEKLVENTIAISHRSLSVAHRYYACRRAMLGLDRLYPWDLEPIARSSEPEISWPQAREIVEDAFGRLSPAFLQPLLDILDGQCVDAESRPSKQPTGFTLLGTPSTRPFVSVNYLGRPRDVLDLAHELAHAVHARLSAGQSMLSFRPSTLLTEAFASLAEIQISHSLSERSAGGMSRLDLVMMCLQGCVRSLCYPAVNHAFEAEAHRAFREGSATDGGALAQLWHQTRLSLYGNEVVELDEDRWWWSRLPHWTAPPGYWFGYCFGYLLALHLWRAAQTSAGELSRVLPEVISTGGSVSLVEQLHLLGVRVNDSAIWQGAIDTMDEWVLEAESLIASGKEEGLIDA